MTACVIDASVAVKLFFEEELTEHAETLFASSTAQPPARFYVPGLFYLECASVFWKHCRRFGYPVDQARDALGDLHALGLLSAPVKGLMSPGFEIALEYGITVYDASYVTLADRLDVPLVTADEKLVRLLADTEHDVRWLGALSPR